MFGKLLKKKEGFTLIELMIVVAIIGILAAIAIPAFINYVKRSKTSEAFSNLKAMFTGSASYYVDEHWPAGVMPRGTTAIPSTACAVSDGNTGNAVGQEKATIDWEGLRAGGMNRWDGLNFNPADPVYYNYSVVDSPGDCGNTSETTIYTFHATGDLDGDGETSLFEVSAGSDDSNQLYRSPGIYRIDELE